ncbi:hypothetical protein Syn6312_1319 [Synechococcus sp. PCC 6312]|nr:hypothetical protein Syn6312_1319 [Synechococcus sp. PCC 6312]
MITLLICVVLWGMGSLNHPAWAGLTDDHFDGNIFALYGGNGSLVPPRVTLAQSLQRAQPTLLVYYINDSSDCKAYTTVVSQLQSYYGRAADFIPIDVDSIPPQTSYNSSEPGYYYQGLVPQTVLLDATGKIVFNQAGNVDFAVIDDKFRDVFNLLPRTQSLELKPRPVNEINVELSGRN